MSALLLLSVAVASLVSLACASSSRPYLYPDRPFSALEVRNTFGPLWATWEELNGPSSVLHWMNQPDGDSLSWSLDYIGSGPSQPHYSILALIETISRHLLYGVETADGNRSVLHYDQDWYTQLSTITTDRCDDLAGVDHDGTSILTACGRGGGVSLKWIDVDSGEVKNSTAIAGVKYEGAALSSVYNQPTVVLVLDASSSVVRGFSAHFVPLFTALLPAKASCLIASSQTSPVFYTLCSMPAHSSSACQLDVFNATSGASMASHKIAESCSSARSLSAADDGSGEVYFVQPELNCVTHTNGSQLVHDYALLYQEEHFPAPSSIATAADSSFFVAYAAGIPGPVQGIVRMDQEGLQLHKVAFPRLNCSNTAPFPQVAVSSSDHRVYAPLCNGTVLVLDLALRLVNHVHLNGERLVPGAIAMARNGTTMFITNANHSAVVSEYDVHSGKVLRSLDVPFKTAAIGHIAVTSTGEVWGTDSGSPLVYRWAVNGSVVGRVVVDGTLAGIAFDAQNDQLLVQQLTYDGSWTLANVLSIDIDTGNVTKALLYSRTNAKDQLNANAIAVAPNGRVYYSQYDFNTLWSANTSTVPYPPADRRELEGPAAEHRHRQPLVMTD